jgi:exonuclease SbcC
MLPLKLSITGFVFVSKKQTIDFEELTNVGLFDFDGSVLETSVLEAWFCLV